MNKVESITFICEYSTCNNEKTQNIKQYEMNNRHFCSVDCSSKAKRKKSYMKLRKCKGCKKVKPRSEMYFNNNNLPVWCNECTGISRIKRVEDKKARQREFVLRFNKTNVQVMHIANK